MNKAKKISQAYHKLRPELEKQRAYTKLRQKFYGQMQDENITTLRRMATKMKVPGRSSMTKEELVQACSIRAAVLAVKAAA